MKTPLFVITSLLLLAGMARADIPHPSALDAAAITQDRLDDIGTRALVLGNGDLNALLWERKGIVAEGEYAERTEAAGRKQAIERIVADVIEGALSQW